MRLTTPLALALAAAATVPATRAAAQPAVTIAAPTPPPSPSSSVSADPSIDRGFLLPTAETQPAGSVTFFDHELIAAGVSLGVTDDLQLSATTLVPIAEDMPTMLAATAKLRLLATGRTRLAVHGGLAGVSADDERGYLGSLGGTASVCLDAACHSLASATLAFGWLGDGSGSTMNGALVGASLVQRLSRTAKLQVELSSGSLEISPEEGGESLTTINYGLRFHSDAVAVDLGFMRPVDRPVDELPLGFPFVSLAYRNR